MYSTSLICSLEQSYEILQISEESMEIFGNMAKVTKWCGRGVDIKMTTTLKGYIFKVWLFDFVFCDFVPTDLSPYNLITR